jgi:hypothetical protein
MSDLIDRRTGVVAAVTTVLGVVFFLALEIGEEPEMSALEGSSSSSRSFRSC